MQNNPFARVITLPVLIVSLVLSAACQMSIARPGMDSVDITQADHGMVVSVTRQASMVGRDVLERGGNAVDAAIATAFALAVTWPEAGNIGGGGFMMVAPTTGGDPVCIDYRETAPGTATESMFANDANRHNYRAVGVPGTVAGLAMAHKKYGSMPWSDLVIPAVELARDGYTIDKWQAYSLNRVLIKIEKAPRGLTDNLQKAYGNPNKANWERGDRIRLPELARTLQQIADDGATAFYEGLVADQIVADMSRNGGLISKQDLAEYRAIIRKPIHGTFQGYDIYAPPPPSSGGITLIEALNILDSLKLDPGDRYSAHNTHKLIEAMRRAFRDRAAYLGDPDFVSIPSELTQKQYGTRLASEVHLDRATKSEDLLGSIQFSRVGVNTTHFSVIDSKGMAVSNTYTLEQAWGSRMVVSGAGFVLNNEMGDFNWTPGMTNERGRIGTAPNLIRPGKRMLSSQCPVILMRDGEVALVTGSPGGRTIINTVLNVILNYTFYEMPLAESIDAPRVHHQWFPDEVRYESLDGAGHAAAVTELRAMGHRVVAPKMPQGSAHSIAVVGGDNKYLGVADKRRGGAAVGY